jgi:hypothetical protein
MQERRAPVVPVDPEGLGPVLCNALAVSVSPLGIRAFIVANNTPIHDIRCYVTLAWTRVGMYATLRKTSPFITSPKLIRSYASNDTSEGCSQPGLPHDALPPYAAARLGVQTNHLPNSPSPLVWPAAVSPE